MSDQNLPMIAQGQVYVKCLVKIEEQEDLIPVIYARGYGWLTRGFAPVKKKF